VLDLDRDVNAYTRSRGRSEQPVDRRTAGHAAAADASAGINRPDKGHSTRRTRDARRRGGRGDQPGVVVGAPGVSLYSNIGFLLVQLVLEATGKSTQLARELVFTPLGMNSSTVTHPLAPEWRARWGVPHDEKGVAHARDSMPNAVAHGGLVTSASDLARLAIEIGLAYQGRSTQLLSKRSAELMLKRATEFNAGFGVPLGQGLGVMLLGSGATLHFLHPGGNDPGANCWVIMSPATGKGAVIMTNAAAGEALMLEVLASIAHQSGWPDQSMTAQSLIPAFECGGAHRVRARAEPTVAATGLTQPTPGESRARRGNPPG
jgi:CubicO group peptidase (beta-lactamase class C family)